jgi:glycosyltransferase involved in cell wall biosynthesis
VVLAHDYLTQRGGAERVVLHMVEAFPGAPVHTTLYHPAGTFPEYAAVDVHTGALDRLPWLRRNHRLAFPLLAPEVSRRTIEADVVLASSSGWAHGFRTDGQMVVYCHAPARWLYQSERYLGSHTSRHSVGAMVERAALATWSRPLRRWDVRAARRADRYLVNSSVIAQMVRDVYGIEADVLFPPPALVPGGAEDPLPGVEPGFLLTVARLMPYKNIDLVIEAVRSLDGPELVVVGHGPDRDRLAALAADLPGVHMVSGISDATLRWLYRHASALVAASFEDFGLSPLEANAFGTPVVALRAGGYLDTVVEGSTGLFFDAPTALDIAEAIDRSSRQPWDELVLTARAERFGAERFVARLREVVAQVVR